METAGIGVAWIDGLVDRIYLTGSAQNGVLLLPQQGPAVFYVRKSLARAEQESPLEVRGNPGRRELHRELSSRAGGGPVGLAMDVTPAATMVAITEQAGVAVTDLSRSIRLERARKSEWEIEQLRQAGRQIQRLFNEIVNHIHPGMTELELTGTIEGRLRSFGHPGTIRVRRPGADIAVATVVSGASAFYPTGFDGPVGAPGPTPPTAAGGGWKRLAPFETVMLDIVTSHNGYHVDTARSYYLGEAPPSEIVDAHERCREALRSIERRLRPGAACDQIYLDTLAELEEAGLPAGFMGYGENRVRFLGHGVGLELDELPVLAERMEMQLEPGMVLAVEPKAFFEPFGPAGVENTYVVTAEEPENLCPLDDSLIRI